jgi:multiple sugar transport system substrate-binding protein
MEANMKRVLLLMLLVTLALGPGLVAQTKATEVVFWNGYTGPDRVAVEKIVADFNAKSADVKIKMEIMPWDSLYQKLLPAMIAGSGPDIIGYSAGRVAEYAQAGRLEALDGYFAGSSLKRDVLAPGLIQAGTFQKKLYSVPMAFACEVMYYNKAHFTEAGLDPANPPKNLDELKAAWAKLLKVDAAGNVLRYPQAIAIKATVPMIPLFVWSQGADVINAAGKSGLSDAKALAAMTLLRDAFVKGKVAPVGLTGQEADNLFAAGKASIEFNGPWAINGFRGAGIDLGIAELPAGPAGRVTWSGDTVLSINKASKAKKAAWKFLEYWNSAPTQSYWSSTVAFPPSRLDMGSDAELAKNKDLGYFLKSVPYAKSWLPGQTKAARIEEEILVPMYESVFRGLEEPAAALKKADAALTSLLAEK